MSANLTLDDDLRGEGKRASCSCAINDLRKARYFEISDRITVRYYAGGELAKAIERHRDWIMTEVLATELSAYSDAWADHAATFEIVGDPITLQIERAYFTRLRLASGVFS